MVFSSTIFLWFFLPLLFVVYGIASSIPRMPHWNGLGAYYAAKVICDRLGLELKGLDEFGLQTYGSPQDLVAMLGVSRYLPDINQIPNYGSVCKVEQRNEHENMCSYFSSNHNGKRMLLLGDSFCEMLVPALATTVERLDVSKSRLYQLAASFKYDYVVYELVERVITIVAHHIEPFVPPELR